MLVSVVLVLAVQPTSQFPRIHATCLLRHLTGRVTYLLISALTATTVHLQLCHHHHVTLTTFSTYRNAGSHEFSAFLSPILPALWSTPGHPASPAPIAHFGETRVSRMEQTSCSPMAIRTTSPTTTWRQKASSMSTGVSMNSRLDTPHPALPMVRIATTIIILQRDTIKGTKMGSSLAAVVVAARPLRTNPLIMSMAAIKRLAAANLRSSALE